MEADAIHGLLGLVAVDMCSNRGNNENAARQPLERMHG